MDILPTVAELLGVRSLPNPIDGRSVLPVWLGRAGARSPHEALFFYAGEELQAVRSGDHKLHVAHDYLTPASPPGRGGKPANWENMKPLSITQSGIRGIASRHGYEVARTGRVLYDLRKDVGETRDLAGDLPGEVRRLEALAERIRADLGDALTGRRGAGLRPVGKAD